MFVSHRFLVLLVGVVALFSGGCAVNPVTGEQELTLVSESQEKALGQKNYGPYRQAQGGDYAVEPGLTRYVQQVGGRLVAVSDRTLPYEFRIINDSTPNAWALPGGKIAINRGLLVELESEAELAAVLAHEIVHAAARHSAQSMERGMLLQGALVAAGVALGDSEYAGIGMLGASLGGQMVQQRYSREAETEADAYGMRYMARAGYDPAAAVDLQETFVRLAEGRQSNWLEGLFASHPPSPRRVAANRALLAEMGNPGGEIGRERYARETARLRRSKPAYEAYDVARKAFEQDDLGKALRKVNEAIRIEPDEAAFYGLRGEIRTAQKDTSAALRDLDKAVALNPDYYRPLLQRGMTRRLAGDEAGAAGDLQRSIELLPTAEGYLGLGVVAESRGQRDLAIGYLSKAATSRSGAGRQAGQHLAKLDLEQNPARYVRAGLGLTQAGYLVVRVENRSQLPVAQVEVAVGQRTTAGLRGARSLSIDRTIGPGKAVQVATEWGPVPSATARQLAAQVTKARLAR
jgi:predicted Zn-dependent protease